MERRWHRARVEERISSDWSGPDDFLIVESRVLALFCVRARSVRSQKMRPLSRDCSEDVQKAAGHSDPGTTKLYDRRG